MSVYDEELWQIMERKAEEEGEASRRNDWHEYVAGVREVCDFGIDRAKLIRDTFPLYTLHDETHICNVLRLMHELLGSHADKLMRDEAALLVICACCHDVGMSYKEKEKEDLLKNKVEINKYLDRHPDECVRAYKKNPDEPDLDDEMKRSFFRSIHHKQVRRLLYTIDWPGALASKVRREDVVRVCVSHGNSVASLDNLDGTYTIDLRMCAVLLRLADILDFDDSRAPKAIYDYCGFAGRTDKESKKSAAEWEKHRNSWGFNFPSTAERKHGYELEYCASCDNPQVEQGVHSYLDWVDKELRECGGVRDRFHKRWRKLVLPRKVDRSKIERSGYESGEFRLTLDQDKVLELLVGNDLYTDRSVFVRELIQNAIDAVRTRQELDKYRPDSWKPRIDICTWTDREGYHWFSIKDNGVGMTKDTILNHLLKVGSSYYASDAFQDEKRRHNASLDYTPISRFGIGILSCFMADDESVQVEISTRHYEEKTPLRLSINGTSGLYRLCNGKKNYPNPGPMQKVTGTNGCGYLLEPGTAIAVRTNLYAIGIYGGFKEIVDKYVAFPPAAIHYEGDEGAFPYPSEQELVAGACGMDAGEAGHEGGAKASVVDLPIPADAVEQIQRVWPEFCWPQDVRVQLGRLSLGAYAASPHVSGVAVAARTVGHFPTFVHRFGTQQVEMRAHADLEPADPIVEDDRSIRLKGSIRLKVVIEPTGMSGWEVSSLRSQIKKLVYPDKDVRESTGRGDPRLADLLDALRSPDTWNRPWRTSLRERLALTEEELDREIKRARGAMCQITGLEPKEIKLALTLCQKHEWHFAVCDLATLDWFGKWFGESQARTSHRMLVAHNGISCGSAESLFCDKDNKSQCVAAILLLKDRYRPDLGLARDAVRGYTLETQLVLELMRRRIQADGYHLGEDYPTRSADYHLLAAKAYEEVLANNKTLAHDLTLTVDGGVQIRIGDLFGTGRDHGLATSSSPILAWDDRLGVLAQRYQRFCLARVQQVFTIRASFHGSPYLSYGGGAARLFPKEAYDLPEGYRLFPPGFFALPLSQEDTCLTTSDWRCRRWINAAHPLAAFLLQNADTLHKRTPGIFAEFVRCLAEDDGDDLVAKANELVERLRGLRNVRLNIPANLKDLTDNDLD